MKLVTLSSFAVGLVTSVAFTVLTALGQTSLSPKPFLVFDATGYSNKPDFSVYGIQPIALAYTAEFGPDWYKDANRLPDLQAVQAVAKRKAQQRGNLVVLDIEHWPLDGLSDSVQNSLTKYLTVLQWFRAAAPGLLVGYYGAPPLRDYGRAITDTSSQEYRHWMEKNDQVRSLAGSVDVLFPSLYTFYPDQAGWKKYAIAQIEEARRYGGGKPVYVFLWPQYHDSNLILGGGYLPADYWLLQLQTAKIYADGIVIWGGWDLKMNKSMIWDDNAPWWKVTKEFMKNADQSRPTVPKDLTVR